MPTRSSTKTTPSTPVPAISEHPAPSGLAVTLPKREDERALPDWFLERSRNAWQDFQRLPLPGTRNENWRYSNANRIPLGSLHPAVAASAAVEQKALAASQIQGLADVAARFVFVNERLVQAETPALPPGVICLPLDEALRTRGEVLQKHFMKREAFLGSAKFAMLHLAHVKAGMVIHVPKNVVLEKPIEVFHWAAGTGTAVFPHTLVITDDHAQVTVVDHYRSFDEDLAFACAVSDLVAGAGSRITYAACQEMGTRSQAMLLSSTAAHRDAHVKSFQAQLGAEFSRSESVSDLVGEGSRSDMLSVSLPTGEQMVDQRTLQRHLAPHACSDLLYKNALYDRTRTVFAGLIHVFEGAHYTDAYQTCRNLLNSEEAEANSMPGLEINADQVKCSHGSTSGPVSDEELFYLKSRGISDAASRRLIVLGFLSDALERLGDEALKGLVMTRIEEKMARMA